MDELLSMQHSALQANLNKAANIQRAVTLTEANWIGLTRAMELTGNAILRAQETLERLPTAQEMETLLAGQTGSLTEAHAEAVRQIQQAVRELLEGACETEPFPPARETLQLICHNADVARERRMPICQDTGMAVVFADVGQDVHIAGDFAEAVNEGVRRGYVEGLLRKSVVGDPLRRVNTGDNTPAVLHTRLVPGDTLTLTVAPKGFGSENMSQLRMLTPASGIDGVKRFVLDTVRAAGANPCRRWCWASASAATSSRWRRTPSAR